MAPLRFGRPEAPICRVLVLQFQSVLRPGIVGWFSNNSSVNRTGNRASFRTCDGVIINRLRCTETITMTTQELRKVDLETLRQLLAAHSSIDAAALYGSV